MKKDSVMKKLFKYIGKYWILLILSIILAGISVVLQLYVPVLFGNAIDEIVAAHNVDFTQMWLYLKQILLFVVIAAAAIWIMLYRISDPRQSATSRSFRFLIWTSTAPAIL